MNDKEHGELLKTDIGKEIHHSYGCSDVQDLQDCNDIVYAEGYLAGRNSLALELATLQMKHAETYFYDSAYVPYEVVALEDYDKIFIDYEKLVKKLATLQAKHDLYRLSHKGADV